MRMGRFCVAGVVAVGCLLSLPAPAFAVVLVKDGGPAATIVISRAALDAAPYEPFRNGPGTPEGKARLAAAELRDYLKKMTGAELPIAADDDAAVRGPVVLVGPSARVRALPDLRVPAGLTRERREEGFLIATRGDGTLVLAGNDAGPYFGTNYAVYELLHRLGVRWYMPGDLGEVVPRTATVEVKDLDLTRRPSFPMRSWWSNQTEAQAKAEGLWKLRNKMNAPDGLMAVPGDSHLRMYMPDAALVATRPELFAKTPEGQPDPLMPNLSNPDAARAVAERVVAALREAEQRDGRPPHSIGFAPDDGLPMDFTPRTMKELNQGMPDWNGREGVATELSTSEEWFTFMNAVTAEVVKSYPDVIVTTNGYVNRANPPVGVTPHPNIGIMYACIWADTLKPLDHPRSWHGHVQAAQLKRWTELSKFVFLYEYNLTMIITALTPVPQVRKTAANYGRFADWGLFGFVNEARMPYMEEGVVTRYVRARYMWDAKQDLAALLDDYYAGWYGPTAAPHGRAFWTEIEDALLASPLLGREDRILPYVYTPQLLASLEKHAAEAERRATDEPYRTRVRVDRLTLEHLKAYMDAAAAEMDGRYGDAAAAYQRMVDRRVEIAAISDVLVTPPSREGIDRYVSGETYWGILDRRDYFKKLADLTGGPAGDLLAMSPKALRFALDEAGVGRDLGWFAPSFDRTAGGWRDIDATRPFYAQGYLSDAGVPYVGRMWYVTELDVPASAAGRTVKLYTPTLASEGWVWVNGEYVGRRRYRRTNVRPQPLEMDVTKHVRPGQRNTVAIWVSTGTNRQHAPEGIVGRLFLYAPK